MIFNCYGDLNNPVVVVMHGMCQDWTPMYKFMKSLEDKYYLIIPAMDGFYKVSGEFTSFEDQARQIEEYVKKKHNGKIFGFYGVSQGALLGCELLARK